jgi:hypothetical protein
MIVLSPTVPFSPVEPRPPQPLPRAMAKRHVGVLNNQKPNAPELLQQVMGRLQQSEQLGPLHWALKSPPVPTSEEELGKLAVPEVSLVIVASADCGSCTSWCVHDAIALEKRGKPAIVISTEAFLPLARAEAAAYGVPDLRIVSIPHPLAGVSDAELEGRAARAAAGIKALLLGAGG